jgi:hypothetical protein
MQGIIRAIRQGLKPSCLLAPGGTAEQAAEKVAYFIREYFQSLVVGRKPRF